MQSQAILTAYSWWQYLKYQVKYVLPVIILFYFFRNFALKFRWIFLVIISKVRLNNLLLEEI